MPSRIEETLGALRIDVDRTGLPGAQAVRRRGDRRTRNQAVTGGLALVLAVGVAVGVGMTGGDDTSLRNVPATPTEPAPAELVRSLSPQPLLDPADLGSVGIYAGWRASPDPGAADQPLSRCVPAGGSFPATESASRLYFTDLDASVTEHVLRLADTDGSAVVMDQIIRAVEGCDPGDPADEVSDRSPAAVVIPGSDAVHASRSAAPPGSERSYFEVGVARSANVVVLLQWSSMGRPEGVDWVWDADRLQAALDRAVARQ